MRDSRTLAKRRRRHRRAMLVLVLLAGTPALADQPQNNTFRILPPLPLKSIAQTEQVQSNPFCATPKHEGGVQLASGTDSAAIRLKPIGAAIGLHEIDQNQSGAATPQNGPTMIVESPSQPSIRTNPMVRSEHRQNNELVDAPLTAAKQAPQHTQSSIKLVTPRGVTPLQVQAAVEAADPAEVAIAPLPTAAISPPKPVKPEAKPLSTPTPEATQESSEPASVASMIMSRPDPLQKDAAPEASQPSQPAEDSEPIFFSFSDDVEPSLPLDEDEADSSPSILETSENSSTVSEIAPVVIAEVTETPEPGPTSILDRSPSPADVNFAAVKIAEPGTETVANPFVRGDNEPSEQDNEGDLASDATQAVDEGASVLTFDAPVKVDESPVAFGVVEPIRLEAMDALDSENEEGTSILSNTGDEAPNASDLTPLEDVMESESGETIAIYRSEPAVAKPIPKTEPSLHTKRYRPPVAVKQVPIAFERKENASQEAAVTMAAVQPVAEMKLDNLGVDLGPDVKLTPLHMNQAQVRSLTLGGSVRGVRVGDKGVCQAFASGPNQLKLIGTGKGITRLVVWAEREGEQNKTMMRAFEIHVSDVAPTEGESVSGTAKLLNQSIQRAFPNCRVNVQLVRGELHVAGKCDNQESAKKILRMVRKSCLIPVRDQLSVQ
ncbi:MAG: pilus assembly protein N-terminal domain-containing protein [Rubripirellula sp.]